MKKPRWARELSMAQKVEIFQNKIGQTNEGEESIAHLFQYVDKYVAKVRGGALS